MKHNHVIGRMISACVVIAALLVCAGSSRAAMDYYLKIDGVGGLAKGFHKTVICTNGVCNPGRLKAGTYSVQIVDKTGKPATGKEKGWIEVNSFQWGTAKVPATVSNPGTTNTQSSSDIASGATSGKRMHKPITIRKEVDEASPMLFTIAVGDVDNDGMADLKISLTFQKISF